MTNHTLDTDTHVFFYEQEFCVFSNFSAFSIWWKRYRFPTSEHAYQYEKFLYFDAVTATERRWIMSAIRSAYSAYDAVMLAEQHRVLVRPDWQEIKIATMRNILMAKVTQHEYIKRKLLETGDRELVENSWRDSWWGWGEDRKGHNMLGKLWMEIRAGLTR